MTTTTTALQALEQAAQALEAAAFHIDGTLPEHVLPNIVETTDPAWSAIVASRRARAALSAPAAQDAPSEPIAAFEQWRHSFSWGRPFDPGEWEAWQAAMAHAARASQPATPAAHPVAVTAEDLIDIARRVEGLKRECGMDPESPIAIQNGRYMAISYALRDLAKRAAPTAPQAPALVPLTDAQIEQGRDTTFSINNPFCPCDRKTMQKAVRWAERAHGIGITPTTKEQQS